MDELVKRLRSLKVLLGTDSPEVRGWSSAVQQAAQKTVNDAIAALSAQPQPQEPVAWRCKACREVGALHCANPEECGGMRKIEFALTDDFIDEIASGNVSHAECETAAQHLRDYKAVLKIRAAPPSGVREGMLLDALQRAQSVMRGEVTDDQGKAWDMCAEILDEAITRAAEQVDADNDVVVPMGSLLQRIMSRLTDMLDDDKFNEIDGMVRDAGYAPPLLAAAKEPRK